MIHFSSLFDYSLLENIKATYALIKTKLATKQYTDIGTDELLSRMEAGEQLTIVDCRRPKTFRNIGHIKGALNVPVKNFADDSKAIPTQHPVVVVCYFGYFCQIASQELASNGYRNVLSMKGGMEEWIMSGKPITKD